jgi:hypothetical protein
MNIGMIGILIPFTKQWSEARSGQRRVRVQADK